MDSTSPSIFPTSGVNSESSAALCIPPNSVEPKPSPLDLSLAPQVPTGLIENNILDSISLRASSPSRESVTAVMQLSSQDRLDAIAERKKNMELMNCLAAYGISVKDINSFIQTGAIAQMNSAQNLFVESPQSLGASPPSMAITREPPSSSLPDKEASAGLLNAENIVLASPSWSSIVSKGGNKPSFSLEYLPPPPLLLPLRMVVLLLSLHPRF